MRSITSPDKNPNNPAINLKEVFAEYGSTEGKEGLDLFIDGFDACCRNYGEVSRRTAMPETFDESVLPLIKPMTEIQLGSLRRLLNSTQMRNFPESGKIIRAENFINETIIPETNKLPVLYGEALNKHVFAYANGWGYCTQDRPSGDDGLSAEQRAEAWRKYGDALKRIRTMGRALRSYLGFDQQIPIV
jgi:hypothetical protein